MEHLEAWRVFYDDEATEETARYQANEAPACPQRRRRIQRVLRQFNEEALSQLPESIQADYINTPDNGDPHRDALEALHRDALRGSIDACWNKLNEYYKKTGDSPLYSSAVILHPMLGLTYLENAWPAASRDQWIRDTKAELRAYLGRWYRPADLPAAVGQQEGHQEAQEQPPGFVDAHFDHWISNQLGIESDKQSDELTEYLSLGNQPSITEAATWWQDRTLRFPTLKQLAIDLWAIPAMADDCERVFSQAKLSITSQRNSMSIELLEELQCLKQWSGHKAEASG
jgi:hAT family C-terminal dimerisation region